MKDTSVVLVDDLDGTEATETIEFSLDAARYTIDLSEDNAARLRDTLAVYVDHARRVSGRRHNPVKRRPRDEVKAIREWAQKYDSTVSPYGRIPVAYVEAWDRGQDTSVFEG